MIRAGDAAVLGPQTEHFWLVQRMAKAAGVNLVQAWDAGLIDHEGWSGIVTRCRGCQWTDGCRRILDKPVTGNRTVPEACRSREWLDRIRAKLEEASP